MPEVEIDDLASIGVVRDKPAYMLPPEAWNVGLNVRFVAEGVETLRGWESVLGAPGTPPHFAMPLRSVVTNFWLYAGLASIFVYNGAAHTDITRVGGPYSASASAQWNGTLLSGVPIFNNGIDVPQYWPSQSVAVRMANLINWPSNLRATIVRALGPFLIALGLTDSGVSLPHTIQWSHPADPGSVPISWDFTDPTIDAGRKDLTDVNAGIILDALPLQSSLFVYKEGSVWRMTPIGGRFIFSFITMLESVGILAARCVTATPDGTKHVFAAQDDIYWHNGSDARPILEPTLKRRLFSEIDGTNYRNSFMFANPLYNEVWFCYPSTGNTNPNKAVILNFTKFPNIVVSEADGITFRNAAIGSIETPTSGIWSDPGTWEEDVDPWATVSRRKVLLSDPTANKFFQLDSPQQTRNGVAYTVTLRREGLAIIGRKRNGEWIEDYEVVKLLARLWPKIQGDPVNVRFGVQEIVGGTTVWSQPGAFTPDSQVVIDLVDALGEPISGRGISIEFSTTAAAFWRLDGYKIDLDTLGNF